MELTWLANRTTSALAATHAVLAKRALADSPLANRLEEPATELRHRIAEAGITGESFFAHAVPLSLGIDDPHELAAAVLNKLLGSVEAEPRVTALGLGIGHVQRAAAVAQPDLLDELDARSRPLLEQWEARGPGLLRAIGRATDPDLLAERADVALVFPISGGDGEAHPLYNSVTLEAVLTNPHPDLPEVVRLAWLLSQLNFDVPRYAERLPGEDAVEVIDLAMLPATLEAAAHVELTSGDEALVAKAIEAWRVPCGAGVAPAQLAQTLTTWWRTHLESRPPWPVALAALSKMLPR